MVEASSDRLAIFRGVASLALHDGNLSGGEKRLLTKLAHSLRLKKEEPGLAYESIVNDGKLPEGEEINQNEKRLIYGQILESFLIHTDRSDEAIQMIAYLRLVFEIEESEHRAIIRSLDRKLEEIVHRTVLETVRYEMKDSMGRFSEIIDRIRLQK